MINHEIKHLIINIESLLHNKQQQIKKINKRKYNIFNQLLYKYNRNQVLQLTSYIQDKKNYKTT